MRTRKFNWVQFVFGLFVAFPVTFLAMSPFENLWTHMTIALGVSSFCAFLAGRYGDEAWELFVRVLLWIR